MAESAGVVIVGASLAGFSTAEALRDEGFGGPITLIGEESGLPYSRPPLSKQVLSGVWSAAETVLGDEERLRALRVTYLPGAAATSVDLVGRTVRVGVGTRTRTVPFDELVVATGVKARRLANPAGLAGIHSLRTAGEAAVLRSALADTGTVVVVGSGILGCEIAAVARAAGHQVTMISRSDRPAFGRTGGQLADRVMRLLMDNGVQIRRGVSVAGPLGRGTVAGLLLSDGSIEPADVVIGAIGCHPNVEFLVGTGLDLGDGILCDRDGLAAPGVHAVGDVARWTDPIDGTAERVEHQATAIEQARAVAHHISAGESSAPIAPFFWSELFATRILVHGRPDAGVPLTVLAGDPDGARFVAATVREGRTTGLIGWNMPREFRQERARLLEQQTLAKGTPVS